MSTAPQITLAPLDGMTRFAPLVALGCLFQTSDLFSPIRSRLQYPAGLHTDHPQDAIFALLVSMLAGCRSVQQINTVIRPDRLLAQAWGQDGFPEQSTIARVLDVSQAEQVQQLRAGETVIFRWISQTARHNWVEPLWTDIDLTALPTSARAQGSTKGYFPEKRGALAASCAGWEPRNTMRALVRCSTPAIPTVIKPSNRPSGRWKIPCA